MMKKQSRQTAIPFPPFVFFLVLFVFQFYGVIIEKIFSFQF